MMAEPAPDHTRADLQHLVDRHAKARPNTAYRGSWISDGGPSNKLTKLALLVIAAIVVWILVELLWDR